MKNNYLKHEFGARSLKIPSTKYQLPILKFVIWKFYTTSMKHTHLKASKNRHQRFDKIWKGFELDFIKDFNFRIGTYEINLDGNKVPIIFSGMLSGQRALDIGSLERLKWQIKMIIEKKPVTNNGGCCTSLF